MRTLSFVLLGLIATATAARAADHPLLVSVEVAPGVDVSPGEVRHLIATELGTPVVGARDPGGADVADVLLVTVDPHEVRMALRSGTAPVVSRAIAPPADNAGRLRSIGWLAGNLARDQVGPLVATPAPAPAPLAMPSIAEARPPTEPPPSPPAATAVDNAGPDAVVAARHAGREEALPHARWSVTAGGGPTLNVIHVGGNYAGDSPYTPGLTYQIQVRHQSSPDSMLVGTALEVGPNSPSRHYFGAAAFVGSRWVRRAWFLEGDFGVGLEVLDGREKVVTVTNDSSMLGTQSTTTASLEPVPDFYFRAAGVAGVRVSASLDLVAEIGAHLSNTGQLGSFLSSTVGLRLRLP